MPTSRSVTPCQPAGVINLRAAVIGALAFGACIAPLRAAPPTQAVSTAPAAALHLHTPEGRLQFLLDTPDAPTSAASRTNIEQSALAPGKPQPATPGYLVRSHVILRTASPNALAALAAALKPSGATIAPFDPTGRSLADFHILTAPSVRIAAALADQAAADPRFTSVELDMQRPRADRTLPTDPGVPQQWYISNAASPLFDTNVEPAWKSGFTGTGVALAILESGFDTSHPDLAPNYSAALSQPPQGFSSHGTATAGLAAMAANNAIAGAGLAYSATLARLYNGFDAETAGAFLFNSDTIAIKNNSWGPFDNGTIATISAVELAALRDAFLTGRNGKGTVFVWAAGNGGFSSDRVDYDPYASSRYAISVGAIGNTDLRASYSEPGAALMLVSNSSNDFSASNNSGIYTTAPGNPGTVTTSFGGTSASAPIASGIVALMLQARPDLTARDVAHVLIRSARKCDSTNPNWSLNGAGLWQNYDYGFGAIDAGAAVALAQTWPLRPAELDYPLPSTLVNQPIPDNDPVGITSSVKVGAHMRIERVQVTLNAPHTLLGDLRIELTSPTGTKSLLADTRSDFSSGYSNFTFTSARHWDELAKGTWSIHIADNSSGSTGTFQNWSLRFTGSAPPCPCDWNHSNQITVQDVFDFLSDWFDSAADFNNSGSSTTQDIFEFLNCWFTTTGC